MSIFCAQFLNRRLIYTRTPPAKYAISVTIKPTIIVGWWNLWSSYSHAFDLIVLHSFSSEAHTECNIFGRVHYPSQRNPIKANMCSIILFIPHSADNLIIIRIVWNHQRQKQQNKKRCASRRTPLFAYTLIFLTRLEWNRKHFVHMLIWISFINVFVRFVLLWYVTRAI